MTAEALLARLLHRDASMLILDKPAGLPVHKGPGGGPSLEDHLDALRFGLPRRPALAHRLDRQTSGCLVLGRHRQALARLGRLFAAGRVDKVYWAVVVGAPPSPAGRIELPLARRSADPRSWWMRVDPDGQPAVTDYRTLGISRAVGAGTDAIGAGGAVGSGPVTAPAEPHEPQGVAGRRLSWLELRPRTGRTHQLRVHLAALSCPVLGDAIYGAGANPPDGEALGPLGLHLHARAIGVPLQPNRPPVRAVAPPPAHMLLALGTCGLDAGEGAAR